MLTNNQQPTTDPQERLSVTVASLQSALVAVNAANQRPLRPAVKHDGAEVPAETGEDRAATALDELRSALCCILIDSDNDPAATARYMNWLVTQHFAAAWSLELSQSWLRSAMADGRNVKVMDLAQAIADHNGAGESAKDYESAALYWWRKAQMARTLIVGSLKRNHVIVADGQR
ncbi:MAG: hypothetical protein KDE50_16720 [Caldilineaceae bacterium]|nr:hypothetical protein [Caldilineaceae bacterium]